MADNHRGELSERQKMRISAQQDRAADLFQAMRAQLESSERTLQIGFALTAALLTAAVVARAPGVLLIAPAALGVLVVVQNHRYSDLMVLAWERQQILTELHESLGPDVFGREPDAGISRHARSNPSIVLVQLLLGAAVCGLGIAGGFVLAVGHYAWWAPAVYLPSAGVAVLAVAMSALEQRVSWERCEVLRELRGRLPSLTYEQATDAMVLQLGAAGRAWVRARAALLSPFRRRR